MKERPILFSGPMVRALLAGTKTQTRRVVKPQPAPDQQPRTVIGSSGFVYVMDNAPLLSYPEVRRVRWDCPYGQPGDRLWMRESFSGPWCMEAQDGIAAAPPSKWGESSQIWYWADGEPTHGDWTRPRPSIHMPRWASRITLEITSVRVERLQDISEADAIAEGVYTDPASPAYDAYAQLWDEINGPGSWAANPWVWVLELRRINSKEIEHAQ